MKIYRYNKHFKLTNAELQKAYREQLHIFDQMDVTSVLDRMLESGEIDSSNPETVSKLKAGIPQMAFALRRDLDRHCDSWVYFAKDIINEHLATIEEAAKVDAYPFSGNDAVFLPGKIHGCEWQAYILHFNDQANNCQGSWEIEVVDKERIVELYDAVQGVTQDFWDLLPDWFHGEWYYCENGMDDYEAYTKDYATADFIVGRDGDRRDAMYFLLNWARVKEV